MYLGRFTLGQEAILPLHATDNAPSAVAPARAPSVKVFDSTGTQVLSALAPSFDSVRSPGLFEYRLVLGSAFAAGRYAVAMGYAAGGVARVKVCHFDVVAGGDPAGAVVSMYHISRPHAATIVEKTDAGRRTLKRAPYL